MRAQSVALFLLLAAPVWADEVLPPQTGSGTGDMLQSNYDPGTNNAVDFCEALSPDTGVNPPLDYNATLDFVQMDPGRDGNALKNLIVGETVFQVRFTSGDLPFNCTDGAQCFLDMPWIFLADLEMRDEFFWHATANPVTTDNGGCVWDNDDFELACGTDAVGGEVRLRPTDTHSACSVIYLSGGTIDHTADDVDSVWYAPAAVTVQSIWCETDAGTIDFDYLNDDGVRTGVNGSAITCTTSGVTDSTLAGDVTLAAGHTLDMDLTAESTPGERLSACFTYTLDEGS